MNRLWKLQVKFKREVLTTKGLKEVVEFAGLGSYAEAMQIYTNIENHHFQDIVESSVLHYEGGKDDRTNKERDLAEAPKTGA